MLNILKRKNIYLEGFQFFFFSSKSYVLYYSESIKMHIEKLFKKKKLIFCRCPQKTGFAIRAGGGSGSYGQSATIRFF